MMATPTVRRLQLGNELRRLRERAGHTPAQAAQVLHCNVTKISRIELGQSGIAIGDVKLLLESYGDDPEHVAWMMEMARNNRERGRWSGYRAVLPEWFRVYVDLERDAEDIRLAQSELVPGLLQTEDYIRGMYAHRIVPGMPADVDSVVKARQERQELLRRSDGPTVSFVLSESCVRRMIGGRGVMAEQLEHIAGMTENSRVRIQLWPFDTVEAIGLVAAFSILRIPSVRDETPLTFVYCEDFEEARYIDDNASVRIYEALWSSLQAAALGPRETARKLREIAREYR
jgi:transcriptional regulator with XRE-family HTH domain